MMPKLVVILPPGIYADEVHVISVEDDADAPAILEQVQLGMHSTKAVMVIDRGLSTPGTSESILMVETERPSHSRPQ